MSREVPVFTNYAAALMVSLGVSMFLEGIVPFITDVEYLTREQGTIFLVMLPILVVLAFGLFMGSKRIYLLSVIFLTLLGIGFIAYSENFTTSIEAYVRSAVCPVCIAILIAPGEMRRFFFPSGNDGSLS